MGLAFLCMNTSVRGSCPSRALWIQSRLASTVGRCLRCCSLTHGKTLPGVKRCSSPFGPRCSVNLCLMSHMNGRGSSLRDRWCKVIVAHGSQLWHRMASMSWQSQPAVAPSWCSRSLRPACVLWWHQRSPLFACLACRCSRLIPWIAS